MPVAATINKLEKLRRVQSTKACGYRVLQALSTYAHIYLAKAKLLKPHN